MEKKVARLEELLEVGTPRQRAAISLMQRSVSTPPSGTETADEKLDRLLRDNDRAKAERDRVGHLAEAARAADRGRPDPRLPSPPAEVVIGGVADS